MSEREKYEHLIAASPLFALDRELDRSAYKAEARRMVGYLYGYLLAATGGERYRDYGLEITKTATECIENYDPDKGEFLHYFNKAWALEYRRAMDKRQREDARGGLRVPEGEEKRIKAILRHMRKCGRTLLDEAQLAQIAEAIDTDLERMREAYRAIYETAVISDVTENDEGEEGSLFDSIAAEETEPDAESVAALLDAIEEAWLSCQERQRPLLSAMLTQKMCKGICDFEIPIGDYKFLDGDILGEYKHTGRIPTGRELAERFGRDEASISRT